MEKVHKHSVVGAKQRYQIWASASAKDAINKSHYRIMEDGEYIIAKSFDEAISIYKEGFPEEGRIIERASSKHFFTRAEFENRRSNWLIGDRMLFQSEEEAISYNPYQTKTFLGSKINFELRDSKGLYYELIADCIGVEKKALFILKEDLQGLYAAIRPYLPETKQEAQKELLQDLDEWFNKLPAKAVQIITGLDERDFPFAPKVVEENDNNIYKEDIAEIAQDVWENLDLKEKVLWRKKLGKIKF